MFLKAFFKCIFFSCNLFKESGYLSYSISLNLYHSNHIPEVSCVYLFFLSSVCPLNYSGSRSWIRFRFDVFGKNTSTGVIGGVYGLVISWILMLVGVGDQCCLRVEFPK